MFTVGSQSTSRSSWTGLKMLSGQLCLLTHPRLSLVQGSMSTSSAYPVSGLEGCERLPKVLPSLCLLRAHQLSLCISHLLDFPVQSVPCSPGHACHYAFQVVLLKVTAFQALPSNISHNPLFHSRTLSFLHSGSGDPE